MGIIKLQAEGDTFTATVKDAEVVKGQYGEQVRFTTNTGDILFLPKDSAIRQLERLGLAVADAAGETLTFSRDHNPKKGSAPYWGIAVANVRESQPKASPRVSSPYVPPQGRSAGPHIPGLDDDPGPQDPDGPYEPAQTPRERREASTPADAKRDAVRDAYADLWAWCAGFQQSMGLTHKMPVDGASVNAMASTIFIEQNKRGLNP